MWYPSKMQWHVIWVTTLLCLVGWLNSDPDPSAFIAPMMLIGGLFVWQVASKEDTPQ